MTLSRWAAADHPILRRELAQWNKHRRALRWLWPLFLLPPLCGPVALFFSIISIAGLSGVDLTDIEPEAWGFGITGAVLITLWSLQAFWGWGIAVFAVVGTSTAVAHERETQNWAMLRMTLLDVGQILNAKTAAVLRWLAGPIIGLLLLRLICVAATLGFIYLWHDNVFSLDPADLLNWTLVAATFLPLLLLITLTDLIYSCSVGLLASTFLRAASSTLAMSFSLLLLLWLFVYVPIERTVFVALESLIFGASYPFNLPYPYAGYVPALFTFFIVPIVIQVGLSILAYSLARLRAMSLNE